MDGRVAECHVMGSSGFDELDKATCDLVVRRARFLPARDAGGNAAPSSYQNRVRWMIPQSPPLPKAGELVVSFLVRPDGTKADCK
ncbi:energy transducer TonB, partial [Acinetobacter baumannii]